jgi:S-adenosyl methyltransferase
LAPLHERLTGLVPPSAQEPLELNAGVPHSARVWNYWLGGKDNFPADREAAEQFREAFPGVVDVARASRAFLTRTVRYLDVGTGLPTANNTHQVAQRVAPGSRVVYVDNDPIVLAHARALLTGTPEGRTAYVDADLYEPDKILEAAAKTLDFDRPVALMLLGSWAMSATTTRRAPSCGACCGRCRLAAT